MSRYPSATWKPIANRSSQPLQKDLLSLHTCVGPGLGTWNYFNTGAGGRGVYSHIIVCGIWGSDAGKNVDGLALQMQDTNLRAAANLDGNWHIISVETADNAARPIAPWTAAQQTTLVNIMVDAHRIDGIPLVLVPDSKPGRRGISYHRQGCNPYRVAGGELWSTSFGKDCPTQARINQIPGLIARARAIVGGTPAPTPGGPFMALSDDDQLRMFNAIKHLDAMFSQNNTVGDINAIATNEALQGTAIAALAKGQVAQSAQLAEILARLPTPPAGA